MFRNLSTSLIASSVSSIIVTYHFGKYMGYEQAKSHIKIHSENSIIKLNFPAKFREEIVESNKIKCSKKFREESNLICLYEIQILGDNYYITKKKDDDSYYLISEDNLMELSDK